MKVVIIETREDDMQEQVDDAFTQGFLVFMKDEVDPEHLMLKSKFLYYRTDEELYEKLNLLKADISVADVLRW